MECGLYHKENHVPYRLVGVSFVLLCALGNTWCEVRGPCVITCGQLVHGIALSSLYIFFCRVSPPCSKNGDEIFNEHKAWGERFY